MRYSLLLQGSVAALTVQCCLCLAITLKHSRGQHRCLSNALDTGGLDIILTILAETKMSSQFVKIKFGLMDSVQEIQS
jgi:hypothetical protein